MNQIKPQHAADPSELLIIKGGALGDTLMVLPSICDLPVQYRVFFVGREPGLYFISLRAWAVSNMDTSSWHLLFTDAPDSLKNKIAFSRPLSMDCWGPVSIAAFMSDPRGDIEQRLCRLFDSAMVKVFPPFPREEENIHTAYYTALCLKEAGFPIEPHRAMERASRDALIPRAARRERGKHDRPVLHPGSGSSEKNYPTSFWLELIEEHAMRGISERRVPKVLIGPAELDKEGEFRRAEERGLCEVCVIEERRDLHMIISSARYFIGHDSGVTHLAAMMGVPTAALFKKSNPVLWRPLGPNVRVLGKDGNARHLMEEVLEVLSCNANETKL